MKSLSWMRSLGLNGKVEVNEKFKFEGSEGTSEEARVEDLGGMKESLCVELREREFE